MIEWKSIDWWTVFTSGNSLNLSLLLDQMLLWDLFLLLFVVSYWGKTTCCIYQTACKQQEVQASKWKKKIVLLIRSYSNLKLLSLKGIPSENTYEIKGEALTDPSVTWHSTHAVWLQRIELCCRSVREKRKLSNLPSGIRQAHEEFDLVNWGWHVRGGFIMQRRHADRGRGKKSELILLQMDVTERWA